MTFRRRIYTVYRKELVDILRDRRTLIAMIVVPLVLYPLLMLGSIQAVSYQADSLRQEDMVLGVVGEKSKRTLAGLVMDDAAAIERLRKTLDPNSDEAQTLPITLENAPLHHFDSEDSLKDAIRNRQVHVGILFHEAGLVDAFDQRNPVQFLADLEEARSAAAAKRIEDLFKRIAMRKGESRLHSVGLPKETVQYFELSIVNLSSPPSILGQILPLILVLMTITGAIYPAIDLTAGERERGTLESLMVCPVAVIDLIVGKFLVVTTIAILGAALNLASVSATVYFGGFQKVLATPGGSLPVGKMVFILLALIPFAVLMSAIMIAVCSFARTFKEAQNYVTPVIFAVLIPGGIAALPATRLSGVMLVMPVGNMVLLARDLLLGAIVPFWHVAIVLLSTTLYAAAAVAIAANLFGQEAVLFADVGSFRTLLSRRYRKPAPYPTVSMVLLMVALLFPAWFFIQSALSAAGAESAAGQILGTGLAMPIMFVLIPAAVFAYAKIDLRSSLSLSLPSVRYWVAAFLLGISAWIPAFELTSLQQFILPLPPAVLEGLAKMQEAIAGLRPWDGLLYLSLIPAVCEELLFRGVLLGGLVRSIRPLPAVLASAAVFGVFHFVAFRFVPTFALGAVLGFLCWRSRSILPGMLMHALHNSVSISEVYRPWHQKLGIAGEASPAHLPIHIVIPGCLLFLGGLFLLRNPRPIVPRPLDQSLGLEAQ